MERVLIPASRHYFCEKEMVVPKPALGSGPCSLVTCRSKSWCHTDPATSAVTVGGSSHPPEPGFSSVRRRP